MNQEIHQGQSSICDHYQNNKPQNNIQTQNDQLVFIEDRSLNMHKSIQKALISNDEKYLAILRGWRKIQIQYLKNKKIMKNLKLDDNKQIIHVMKFSNNSKYFLFSYSAGFLGCYDINNNYNIIYNQRVHSSFIDNILTIDDDQILTSSNDRSLIITNIKYNQQVLKIENAHSDCIESIDFDKSKDFIISCSSDCSIRFFNRKDAKLQIEQQNDYQTINQGITMIQLIEKDNNLLSAINSQLILWQIDYLSLKLLKLKEFNNRMYNFTSIFNNNKIVVICDKLIKILDKDLIVIQSINHNLKNIQCIYFIL